MRYDRPSITISYFLLSLFLKILFSRPSLLFNRLYTIHNKFHLFKNVEQLFHLSLCSYLQAYVVTISNLDTWFKLVLLTINSLHCYHKHLFIVNIKIRSNFQNSLREFLVKALIEVLIEALGRSPGRLY